ncbi:unnamed protein product, partial [Mesorhabditis belari]|uniref:Uncharacterized protein n=1 Tax=Mesorhabditis belari TaxID=2138241 RepID=A0AAF3J1L9_9BILA
MAALWSRLFRFELDTWSMFKWWAHAILSRRLIGIPWIFDWPERQALAKRQQWQRAEVRTCTWEPVTLIVIWYTVTGGNLTTYMRRSGANDDDPCNGIDVTVPDIHTNGDQYRTYQQTFGCMLLDWVPDDPSNERAGYLVKVYNDGLQTIQKEPRNTTEKRKQTAEPVKNADSISTGPIPTIVITDGSESKEVPEDSQSLASLEYISEKIKRQLRWAEGVRRGEI